jgi:tRNA G10  N-methylase Trm11
MDVNKCIKTLGGKWNSAKKAHVFEDSPADGIDALLLTGELTDWKKEFQFFPTPQKLAAQICDMAELDEAKKILEPSCGLGAIADEIYARNENLIGMEINKDFEDKMYNKPYPVFFEDFLTAKFDDVRFDRIVMNPPFAKQQDIKHITRAYDILCAGGILVAILSPSPFFREDKLSIRFRELISDTGAEVIDVPEGEFRESGTAIRTKIIKIVKAAA